MSLKEFNDKKKYFEESYYEWFYTKTPMGKAQCAIERFLGIETTYDCMRELLLFIEIKASCLTKG